MHVIHVVGARPNFMKIAPVWRAIEKRGAIDQSMVHTGQHYDVNMSDVFFTDLDLPAPDYYLGVGSGSHAEQTAAVMVAFEKVVQEMKPSMVLVYGDVNSTVAAALVCAKLHVPVAHVEAGLRSFDRDMPEEINRMVTDRIADLLFTPSPDADQHLLNEGVDSDRIKRVGNVMIDTLVRLLSAAQSSTVLGNLGLEPKSYAVLTMHRPSNVDDPVVLESLLNALLTISGRIPIVFPAHPRTEQRIAALGFSEGASERFRMIEPIGYLDFLKLQSEARLVLTDSGGIQEETTHLGIPCLTMRSNTERPITIEQGTNSLVGNDVKLLKAEVDAILDGGESWDNRPQGGIPLWDGHAGERVAEVLADGVAKL